MHPHRASSALKLPIAEPDRVRGSHGTASISRAEVAAALSPATDQARSVSLYFDQLDFLMQLGLVPEPEGAPAPAA
jgi:hypothetical protein